MNVRASLALAICLVATASAQTQTTFTDPANLRGERVRPHDGRELPVDQGASGLQQLLRRLNTRASILNIVAHPDDEDGGMLTLYSRGLGARVADLSLTRGEGGQNAMTGDFEDALGLLRTQELLANDRYPGIDQFFGTEVDFGFSKTKEEAFAKWTHERVLYDAVRAIRLYRPLVITATFIGGVTDGHGQHQVSGQIAQEAFKAAADPKVFPEMIAEGILPWQALKIYARVPMQSISSQGLYDYATGQYAPAKFTNYVTGEVTTTQPSVDVVVHEGTPDALLGGKSYVQFARIGLGLQKSQIGPGVRNAPGGTFDVSYHRYGSRLTNQPAHEDSFFSGIDTTLEGIATFAPDAPSSLRESLSKLRAAIDSATAHFNSTTPATIAPFLVDASKQCDSLLRFVRTSSLDPNAKASLLHELLIKHVQLNDALVLALGLTLDAQPADPSQPILANQPFTVNIKLNSTHSTSVPQPRFGMHFSLHGSADPVTGPNELEAKPTPNGWTTVVPVNSLLRSETRPYFTRSSIEQPFYNLNNLAVRNAPATPPALVAVAAFDYEGVGINVAHTVNVLHRYPGGETISEPAEVVPPVSVSLGAHANAVPLSDITFSVPIEVSNAGTQPFKGMMRLSPPPGWNIPSASTYVPVDLPSSAQTFNSAAEMHVSRVISYNGPLRDYLMVDVETNDKKHYQEGFRPVGYPGLISTNFFTPATDRIVPVDLKLPTRTRIAYLAGTGDGVPEALASINLKPTILTIADLTAGNLAKYDTVILGVRTYNAHPDLHGAPTQALLDYARNGGNVVVQYQTYEFTAADAPYPLTLGNAEKVVDETTPVKLLEPTNPLLTTPNRITPADFDNWVEERGHGFLHTWDQHYAALTETHDPGGPETQPQAPQLGGLITTPLGKGRWTYCAFALYRQLPEAVPGAYRLFLNLLNP